MAVRPPAEVTLADASQSLHQRWEPHCALFACSFVNEWGFTRDTGHRIWAWRML